MKNLTILFIGMVLFVNVNIQFDKEIINLINQFYQNKKLLI